MDKILHLADILHKEGCSCVIRKGDKLTLCHQRGVRDLYALLSEQPSALDGAMIADKVVGKGAAALMILGNVQAVYADVISQPALDLLNSVRTAVRCQTVVPHIVNRAGTGMCPVETLCMACTTAEECLPLIATFIKDMNNQTLSSCKQP